MTTPATMRFGAPGPRPGAAAGQVLGGRPPAAPQLPGGGVPRPPRLQYTGVTRSPSGGGGWMARVLVDSERGTCRTIGPFPDPHAAALAHDRVAIAFLGDRARPNFPAAFHPIEQRFLRLCREREGQIDVCALVADPATYEARYATFLKSVLRLKQWGDFKGLVVEFFITRASEIGDDILMAKDGGERLEARFVEMHRNKAVDPQWRASYIRRVLQEQQNQRRQQQLQLQVQQQIAAVQPQQPRWGGSATGVPMHPQQRLSVA